MEAIDISGTSAMTETIARITQEWGETLISLALPQAVARQLTLYDAAIIKFMNWIGQMKTLEYLRFGNWRHGMFTETHRSFTGKMSLGYIMEQRVIGVLQTILPPTILQST